jgi:hypothetical protein
MKIALGPKGRQTMISLLFGYRGHENRIFSLFGNGWQMVFPFTRKKPRVMFMVWWPRGNAISS